MPKSYDVLFASSNTHKYEEAKKILSEFGIKLEFFQTDLVEIQDESLSKIALQKALNEAVTRPGTIFDKFEHMLRVSINYSKAYPHLNQIYLEISTEGLSHLATQLSLKMEKITTVTYEALLTQAKKSGEIRNDVQQQVLAFCVDNIAMMLQFSYASKYYNERMHLFLSPEYAQDEELLIKALVDIFRRGLTT
jgi:hypothetical protein